MYILRSILLNLITVILCKLFTVSVLVDNNNMRALGNKYVFRRKKRERVRKGWNGTKVNPVKIKQSLRKKESCKSFSTFSMVQSNQLGLPQSSSPCQ